MKLNFSDPQIRYLIDYANLKHAIIKYKKKVFKKNNYAF